MLQTSQAQPAALAVEISQPAVRIACFLQHGERVDNLKEVVLTLQLDLREVLQDKVEMVQLFGDLVNLNEARGQLSPHLDPVQVLEGLSEFEHHESPAGLAFEHATSVIGSKEFEKVGLYGELLDLGIEIGKLLVRLGCKLQCTALRYQTHKVLD